jgi:hypothetical protein
MKIFYYLVPPDTSSLPVQILGDSLILDLSGIEQEASFDAGTNRALISLISNE